ncbi:MAG: hypothetical protein RJB13_511, partial [Pseudomonadota bacterium]
MLKQTLVSKNAVCILIYWILAMPLASKAASLPSVDELANSLKKLSAAVESGDFFEAENILKTIPEQVRQSQIQILILEALVDKGFYRAGAARLKLKKALRLDRNNGDALFEMAVLLMEKRLWRRSEILLKAASLSATLKDSRRQSLPYYFGVTAFELGRIFESRN